MKYKKTDKCIGCKKCAEAMKRCKLNDDFTFETQEDLLDVCPVGAIEQTQ